MPPYDMNSYKVFFEINGERIPMPPCDPIEISLESEDVACNSENAINNPECFRNGEMTFKMSRKSCKQMKKVMQSIFRGRFTNNWRKMHHLPMTRRRKRK